MKKVILFRASGHTRKYIVKKLASMADMICDPSLGSNESLSITN